MSAEVPYRLKVNVTFTAEFTWDAVTGQDAAEEFASAVKNGLVEVSDLDLDYANVRIEAVSAEPA